MRIFKLLIFICLFLLQIPVFAHTFIKDFYVVDEREFKTQVDVSFNSISIEKKSSNRPSPLLKLFHAKQKHTKKITAAILAFPLPFGIVGLHRIYLGSAPYVPVVYIATLGGAFGLMPLIDFCVILGDKNTENYVNNNKVFMWVE